MQLIYSLIDLRYTVLLETIKLVYKNKNIREKDSVTNLRIRA